jgi:hypothetical protein
LAKSKAKVRALKAEAEDIIFVLEDYITGTYGN